ncbi:MAG: hypothetical protein Q8P05_03710 [Candidatus Diapherotrites archaeon]|nr:hypothetical protein [Candidatus Diapherotrites archaeon]
MGILKRNVRRVARREARGKETNAPKPIWPTTKIQRLIAWHTRLDNMCDDSLYVLEKFKVSIARVGMEYTYDREHIEGLWGKGKYVEGNRKIPIEWSTGWVDADTPFGKALRDTNKLVMGLKLHQNKKGTLTPGQVLVNKERLDKLIQQIRRVKTLNATQLRECLPRPPMRRFPLRPSIPL